MRPVLVLVFVLGCTDNQPRHVAIDGTFMQLNRYESAAHAVIETTMDGRTRDVFCVVPQDARGRPQGTKVHAEGTGTYEAMTNVTDGSTTKQLVLRDCKLTFAD
jgi:hypothetical protein